MRAPLKLAWTGTLPWLNREIMMDACRRRLCWPKVDVDSIVGAGKPYLEEARACYLC